MDTLKAIQVFIEVAERQSFTQAAEYLELSRAMASRYVDHLESVFNVRLLHRNTRIVSVTTAGEQALVHCYEILKQQQQLKDLSSEVHVKGTLRITMGLSLFEIYLKDVLQSFRALYPQINYDLLITEDIVDVYAQRIDLAFRISQKFAEGLIAYPLKEITSVICASPKYIQANQSLTHPDQLIDHSCIVHQAVGRSGHWALTSQQQTENYPLRTTYSSNEVMVLLQLCRDGQGVAMLPTDLVEHDLHHSQLVQVLEPFHPTSFELCMLYPSRQHLPKVNQLFINFIKQYFKS